MEAFPQIPLVIQAGVVGLCLSLIWVNYKLVSNHDQHLLDALERNTDAWLKNEAALTKLTTYIEKLEQ